MKPTDSRVLRGRAAPSRTAAPSRPSASPRSLASLLSIFVLLLSPGLAARGRTTSAPPASAKLSAADDAFLEDLSRRSFRFFLEHSDPETGLVLDRARTDGAAYAPDTHHYNVASSASTGFGLTALCVAAERGWIPAADARDRTRRTLRFLAERAPHVRGWFLHWMDATTGERRWQSEYSSIDTALLLAGVLTARRCFAGDAEVERHSRFIYERVDFGWMLNGHPTLLSHGWKPETGFLKVRWDTYSEHLILQLLAVGSPTHPITPRAWRAWSRKRVSYAGYTFLSDGPLFVHQYTHAWVDFRGRRENFYPFTDYFANSVAATRAHRQFCVDLSGEFPGYGPDVWGITASDSDEGYVAWGGPPRSPDIDGTVAPSAPAGSLMFTPDISVRALRTMRERFGGRVYGRYGFTDAFNPTTGWTGPDVIGIDVGITLLSAENLRTGNVWRWFMRNPEIPRAMRAVGLRETRRAAATRPGFLPHGFSPSRARRGRWR
ncbi:MAG TPA: glucoamylase family protein [Pyrinomonadaceae bacterium]|nr:glucoamylase family protein [Pyrinomonadaceae bacterium]